LGDIDPISMLQPAATRVRDPLSGRSVWLAGMIKNPRLKGEDLHYDLVFDAAHSPGDREGIAAAIVANLKGLGFAGRAHGLHAGALPVRQAATPSAKPTGRKADPVPGMSGPGMGPHGGAIQKKALDGVRHIIAVASGKGGVGKSTVATNLAVALARAGHEVGLLDADIYGPSIPTMMNAWSRPLADQQTQRIIPVKAHGVRCLSMGMLNDPEQAMIWRGPMVMSAVRQFLQQADWSGCDYLIIDLPPGTGDAQLTLIQAVDLAGAVIVTTPQQVALADAVRGISMFRKLEVPLLGLVENMAWYSLPDGTRDYVFGAGGGVETAAKYETEVLGQIPLQTSLRESGDAGTPIAATDGTLADAFADLAAKVAQRVP
jgi:ATP-binding protein involved in chromosome partitioning